MLHFQASSPAPRLLRSKRSLPEDSLSNQSKFDESDHQSSPLNLCTSDEFKSKMRRDLEIRLQGDKAKAAALEHVIFRQTPVPLIRMNFKDPSEALDFALKQVVIAIMDRITRKDELQTNRTYRLEQALGHRYQEVMALVRKIRILRLARAGSACKEPVCLAGSSVSRRGGSDRPLPTVIPSPVNQLFFHNTLVEIVEHSPISSLSEQDWSGLIDLAKQDLNEYMEWSESTASTTSCSTTTNAIFEIDPSEEFCPAAKRARRISESSGCRSS